MQWELPASAYPKYESFLYFYNMFTDLSIEKVLAIYQSRFGTSTFPNREGAIYSSVSRVLATDSETLS